MKTIQQSNMILHNGEISIIDENAEIESCYAISLYNGNPFYQKEWIGSQPSVKKILYSTASLEGVKQLNRDKFVKPVNVEKIAFKFFDDEFRSEIVDRTLKERINIGGGYIEGFKTGYNANKAEFTMEQAQTIWAHGIEASGSFQDAVKIVRPLSLPKSITIENDEIINVEW